MAEKIDLAMFFFFGGGAANALFIQFGIVNYNII